MSQRFELHQILGAFPLRVPGGPQASTGRRWKRLMLQDETALQTTK